MKIIECIPNFSEGRDQDKVNQIVEAVSSIRGVKVLDFSMDRDHNRSVVTFIGTPEAVERGAIAACSRAVELINMRQQRGVHPRIGAVDVVPFVPLKGASMDDAVETAHRFGQSFAKRSNVPVYFYGEAALRPVRKILSVIRRGQYEQLSDKLTDLAWRPDAGPTVFNARSGATAVGARKPLIAFNVNLNTGDLFIAKEIAKSIRYTSGGLEHVQAIGVPLRSRNIVQVSMNLTDFEVTPVCKVFDLIKGKAQQCGVDILESELIGLIPQAALEGTTAEYLRICDFCDERIIETHI